MNVENYVASSTITNKVMLLFIIVSLDALLHCAAIFCDMNSELGLVDEDSPSGGNKNLPFYIGLVCAGLQVVLQLSLLFWYFFLVWRTFLFRFGLLRQLIVTELPIMLYIPVNFLIFIADRILRFQGIFFTKDYDIMTLYENWWYQIAFWLRNISLIVIFSGTLKAAI